MRYRPLGKTGLVVSEITFGAHGVDNPSLMRAALDAGINTFFTSGEYLNGREEESLGRALQGIGVRRDRLVLISGAEVNRRSTKESILRELDASLRRLRTDRLDVFCNFQVSSPSDLRVDAIHEAFDAAKRAGKAGHLALSGHSGGMQGCLNAALEDGRYEAFLFKYDFVSYPDQAEILRRAAHRGVGAVVFKTSAGNRAKEIRDLEAGGLSLRQASVKWALGNPDVSSVAVTFTNFDQMRELTASIGSALTVEESALLARYRREMYDTYCRFCGVCEGRCPRRVRVAEVMRYDMYFRYCGRETEAVRLYRRLPASRTADACAGCRGFCEAACPFGRQVRRELVEAHRSLSRSNA